MCQLIQPISTRASTQPQLTWAECWQTIIMELDSVKIRDVVITCLRCHLFSKLVHLVAMAGSIAGGDFLLFLKTVRTLSER